jgi:hypothetical protein
MSSPEQKVYALVKYTLPYRTQAVYNITYTPITKPTLSTPLYAALEVLTINCDPDSTSTSTSTSNSNNLQTLSFDATHDPDIPIFIEAYNISLTEIVATAQQDFDRTWADAKTGRLGWCGINKWSGKAEAGDKCWIMLVDVAVPDLLGEEKGGQKEFRWLRWDVVEVEKEQAMGGMLMRLSA